MPLEGRVSCPTRQLMLTRHGKDYPYDFASCTPQQDQYDRGMFILL